MFKGDREGRLPTTECNQASSLKSYFRESQWESLMAGQIILRADSCVCRDALMKGLVAGATQLTAVDAPWQASRIDQQT